MSEDEKLVLNDLNGPSWSPTKKINRANISVIEVEKEKEEKEEINSSSIKQASQDSVRAIMLIRAYRIRGHLIANLDPLSIQKKEEHPELKAETYGFTDKDYSRKIFLDGVLGLQYADLKQILQILKKTYTNLV